MLRRDPLKLPGTGSSAEECLATSVALKGTPGQTYLERRGIPVAVADLAGVRYIGDFAGRHAIVAPLYDDQDRLASLHGRYIEVSRTQDKMLTLGPGGGVVNVLGGWRTEPLIFVEGLFDALSLAVCGFACAATIGRWVPWIPDAAEGREVWLGFDRSRSGDAEALSYSALMSRGAVVRRIYPPSRSKDWNTALVKQGRAAVTQWIRSSIR
jgi:hypothetical protein